MDMSFGAYSTNRQARCTIGDPSLEVSRLLEFPDCTALIHSMPSLPRHLQTLVAATIKEATPFCLLTSDTVALTSVDFFIFKAALVHIEREILFLQANSAASKKDRQEDARFANQFGPNDGAEWQCDDYISRIRNRVQRKRSEVNTA